MTDLNETLPDTQPIEDGENHVAPRSQVESLSGKTYWGHLYPVSRLFQRCDLLETNITFGTASTCTIVITKEQLEEEHHFNLLSRIHFKVKRNTEWIQHLACNRVKVEIEDCSKHGIFVNGRKLSKDKKSVPSSIVLQNNDVIGLPSSCGHYNVYIYVDSYAPTKGHFPNRLKREHHITIQLGAGAFGEVYLTFNKVTGQPSAMKTVKKPGVQITNEENKQRAKLSNELDILKTIDHPNIVKLLDTMSCDDEISIFLEYMEGNDLGERINEEGCLKENISKLFFYQICLGVKYLHEKKIIHRDIKPANVLLASKRRETLVKLTDFGLSKVLTSTIHMKTVCGTKMYAAPELLSSRINDGKYTAQVDIWSLGVLLFVCLSGSEPFSTEPHLIEKHILNGLYVMSSEEWRSVSVIAKNLVDSMLIIDPNKRIKIDDTLKDLWFEDTSLHVKLKQLYLLFGYLPFDNGLPSPPQKKIKFK